MNLTTEHLPKPISIVLDIGAFDGQWTRMLRREKILLDGASIMIDGNNKIHDPSEDRRDIRIAELVGDLDGKRVQFYCVEDHESGNSLYPEPKSFFQNAEVQERQIYTVDTLLQRRGKEHTEFDLILFDIQGSELNAIKGATRTLSKVDYGIIIVKVAVRKFSQSTQPSYLDIQLEMYRLGFAMISILQYYYVTKASGERILTHLDVAWQRREYVTWLEKESWEVRDYFAVK